MIGLNIVKINIPNSLQKKYFFNTTTHNIYNGRSCLPDKKYLGKYLLLMYVHTICIHAHFVSKNLLCL